LLLLTITDMLSSSCFNLVLAHTSEWIKLQNNNKLLSSDYYMHKADPKIWEAFNCK